MKEPPVLCGNRNMKVGILKIHGHVQSWFVTACSTSVVQSIRKGSTYKKWFNLLKSTFGQNPLSFFGTRK